MNIDFKGQHVLITGAGGGIGRATVAVMYKSGATITALGQNLERLIQLKQEV
jgi:L-xylulose reductase